MLECFLHANAVLSPGMLPSEHQPVRCVLLSIPFHSWGNWLRGRVTWPRSHSLQARSEELCWGLLDTFPSLPNQTDTHHRLASCCWDLQHQHLLRACWKYRLSGPTPPALTQHLHFIKIYRCWMCVILVWEALNWVPKCFFKSKLEQDFSNYRVPKNYLEGL